MSYNTELPSRILLTPSEVASFFNVSVRTVYFWHKIGKIQGIKIWRFLRICRNSLDGMAAASRHAPEWSSQDRC